MLTKAETYRIWKYNEVDCIRWFVNFDSDKVLGTESFLEVLEVARMLLGEREEYQIYYSRRLIPHLCKFSLDFDRLVEEPNSLKLGHFKLIRDDMCRDIDLYFVKEI